MSERRFVILESDDKPFYKTISESELKRRLALIAPQDLTYHDGTNFVIDEDINILLHGDKESAEPPMQDPEKQKKWLDNLDKPWPGPDDIIRMRGKYPESREAWIQRMPTDMLTGDWFTAMKQWFREEPR